ncbi:tryptophan-rich sensory protein [Gammaproteobacteria bacterium]|nr:tryptophan-rich sensory protein [Gammaproteobacteria bacterium]
MNTHYLRLVIWIFTLLIISSLIGSLTNSGIESWYQTLNQSPLTPPNFVFGIVWSILYAMIATSGWLIWEAKPSPNLKVVKRLYLAQLVLNWLWSPVFFLFHFTGVSLALLALIIALVTVLMIKSYSNSIPASLLLLPYLVWLIFAAHLNVYIWIYN